MCGLEAYTYREKQTFGAGTKETASYREVRFSPCPLESAPFTRHFCPWEALIGWRSLRVDGGSKLSFARNALTCRSLAH
jgi:hypothetical protein